MLLSAVGLLNTSDNRRFLKLSFPWVLIGTKQKYLEPRAVNAADGIASNPKKSH